MPKFNKSGKRAELNKLTESKVIKQCKKYNIKIYKLSKKEMIDKLLIKLEEKHDKKQLSKAIKKEQIQVTLIEHYAIIVHGLASDNNIDRSIFPNEIAMKIVDYIQFFRILDTCPEKYKYTIKNCGTFIDRKKLTTVSKKNIVAQTSTQPAYNNRINLKTKGNASFAFGVSRGFEKGIRDNIFKIQIYQNNTTDSIGIISHLYPCNNENNEMATLGGRIASAGGGREECHRYYLQHNTIWKHRDGEFSIYHRQNRGGNGKKPAMKYPRMVSRVVKIYTDSQDKFPKRKARDIIMMKVDMDKWELRFYINDKLFGKKIDITPQDMYYPVVHTTDTARYRVLL